MNAILKRSICVSAFVIVTALTQGYAWDGYNVDTGGSIEIEEYDHQGRGEGDVEYYDYESGEYRSGYLDMFPGGSGELTDYETGETYNVEME